MTTAAQLPVAHDNARNRGGAPLGSANAIRHGLRGSSMPKGCGHIERATNRFRREVEQAVLDARGVIELVDATLINSAFRCERHAQLAQRWLRLEAETMTPGDRLNYSREVARASEMRDKAIAALDLPKRPSVDPWLTLQPKSVTTAPAADNAPADLTGGESDG